MSRLISCGIHTQNITLHSVRQGGVTHAARCGNSDDDINKWIYGSLMYSHVTSAYRSGKLGRDHVICGRPHNTWAVAGDLTCRTIFYTIAFIHSIFYDITFMLSTFNN